MTRLPRLLRRSRLGDVSGRATAAPQRRTPGEPARPRRVADGERLNALLLYGAIGAVILFALAIVAYGYYEDRIAPKGETVLVVGTRKFDLGYLERRVLADLKGGAANPNLTVIQFVQVELDLIAAEEVARQTAASLGVSVTEAEIDARIANNMGMLPSVARDVFAAAYRRDVLRVGLPVSQYREQIAATLAMEKIRDLYAKAVPGEGEQADVSLIKTGTQAQALEAKELLATGEGFNLVAVSRSVHPSKTSGGELGWVPRGMLPAAVDDVIFAQRPGTVSDIIEAPDGFYIVNVRERETRPIDGGQRQAVADRRLNQALEEARARLGAMSLLTDDHVAHIGRTLLGSRARG